MNHSEERSGILHWFRVDGRPIFAVPKIETFGFNDEDDYEYEISLKFFRVFSKYIPFFYHFSLEKLALLPLVKEVTPSPKIMIKLL